MMYPLTQMTIYGAIWYQGEANSGEPFILITNNNYYDSFFLITGNPPKYNCTFPAMIADWREKWHQKSQQTDPMFPFGFVQVNIIIIKFSQLLKLFLNS